HIEVGRNRERQHLTVVGAQGKAVDALDGWMDGLWQRAAPQRAQYASLDLEVLRSLPGTSRLPPPQAEKPQPRSSRSRWVNAGRICFQSPTTPNRAYLKMFASASRLMATTLRAPEMPAMCWTAPLMPMVMYRSGATVDPVKPTCNDGGTQPASVTARVAPTAAPST